MFNVAGAIKGGKSMKIFVSIIVGVALALSGGAHAQEKYSLSIATGGTGGVYYPLGGGLANLLSKYVPGMQATAEVTGGSVDNLKLIATGKPYIAFSMADAGQDAYRGEDKFKGNKVPLRTLMILYPNRMHVVSIEGTGVTTMADLKGKRVSTGSPGSATEVMAFRVIDAASTVAAMNRKYGQLYVEDVIPKATYRGMDADNRQATVWNILVSHQNLSDQTAYNIVKTIFDKRDDLIAVHKEAENFKLENQKAAASPIPFHPGAAKYFAERGVKLK